VDSSRLDGNATGGALAEFFVFDVTVARTTCAACGDARPLAELHAYLTAAGTVLRCASCGAVQVKLVRAPDRAWLDLRGVKALQVPVARGLGG
jgi:hypothetical protein